MSDDEKFGMKFYADGSFRELGKPVDHAGLELKPYMDGAIDVAGTIESFVDATRGMHVELMHRDLALSVFPDEQGWLEARKPLLTASDAANVLGVGYVSPLELWMQKTGRTVEEELAPETRRRFAAGHALEPVVSAEAERELGVTLVDPGAYALYRRPSIGWMAATPDRLVLREGDALPTLSPAKLVELKTIHPRAAAKWEGIDGIEPPLGYLAQVQHQMATLGVEEGWLVGMVGLGERLLVVPVVADPDFQGELLAAEQRFMELVKQDIPPDVDATESAARALKALYRAEEPGKVVYLEPELIAWHDKLHVAKETLRQAEEAKIEAENHIKAALGDAEAGELAGAGVIYTWKTERRVLKPVLEERVIETRVFRVKRRKEA